MDILSVLRRKGDALSSLRVDIGNPLGNMITRIYLENYRAFDKLDIQLSSINLLLGPNNSGKSSLISPLAILSQTLQSPDADVLLLLTGKFEDLGTYLDMVHLNDVSKKIKIGLQARLTESMRIPDSSQRGRLVFKIVEKELPEYRFEMTFLYRKQRHEIILAGTELQTEKGETLIRTRYSPRLASQVVDLIEPRLGIPKSKASRQLPTNNFMPLWFRTVFSRGNDQREQIRAYGTNLRRQLRSLEYVGPFRASPERTYLLSGESPSSVGKHGEKAIDILASDEKRRGKQKRGIVKSVSDWLADAGIAKRIEVKSLTDRHFEVLVQNLETNEVENLADTGFGCSQVLPILVAGLNSKKGGILVVQQPEIHLHPKAQAALGTFLCAIAKKGVQIIVETHSEHLLLRLQSHVASRELAAEDVNVYYFDSETTEDKRTIKTVQKISLGEDGLFKEKWPKGFFPERLAEAKRLAGLSVR